MVSIGGGNPIERFALGSVALLWGALGVQYAKRLEVGTRRHPRTEPNPYYRLVLAVAAAFFLGGLYLILSSGWSLMTATGPQR